MKLKLDENLDVRLAEELSAAGVEVRNVLEENLGGAKDPMLWERCQAEGRGLITLDKGFANVLAYPPSGTQGLIVLRPERQLLGVIRLLFAELVLHLGTTSPVGSLWIVELGRIRVHKSRGD